MRGSYPIETDGRVEVSFTGTITLRDATYARFGPFVVNQGLYASFQYSAAEQDAAWPDTTKHKRDTTTHSAKEG